jgi:putative membrane protein
MSPPSLVFSHWQSQPMLEVAAVAGASLYLLAVRRVRGGWRRRRTLAFLAGIGSVLVALQSGVGTFDDRLLSAHMVQHMLLLLVAPLLLLCGHPMTLALRALPTPRRRSRAHRTAAVPDRLLLRRAAHASARVLRRRGGPPAAA